jgi:hypothetical protein
MLDADEASDIRPRHDVIRADALRAGMIGHIALSEHAQHVGSGLSRQWKRLGVLGLGRCQRRCNPSLILDVGFAEMLSRE